MTYKEAIKDLEQLKQSFYDLDINKSLCGSLNMAIEALEKMKWISCSKRLPEEMECVLIQPYWASGSAEYLIAEIVSNVWCCDDFTLEKDEVIAWMPLPEPYIDKVEVCGVTGSECTKCSPGPCQSRKVEKNE